MIKVKLSIPKNFGIQSNKSSIYNFTGTMDNVFNGKKFYINEEIPDAHYWFVIEDIDTEQEVVNLKNNNLIFLSAETSYHPNYFFKESKKNYLSQFKHVYTSCFTDLQNAISSPPFVPWLILNNHFNNSSDISEYEFLKNTTFNKHKTMSTIYSNKQITEYQSARLNFINSLQLKFSNEFDFFSNFSGNKLEKISPYKYHLVLENQNRYNTFSEKLYDSFLGEAFTFYAGNANIEEYFDPNSFVKINLNDFNGSVKKILIAIDQKMYEKNIHDIKNSKSIVLEEFNIIKRIDNIVNNLELNEEINNYSKVILKNKISFENNSNKSRISYFLNKNLKHISKSLEENYE